MNKPTLSKGDAARYLLESIEETAANAQDAAEVWRRCSNLIEGQRRLYTAITGQEAPEFRMSAQVDRQVAS